MGDDFLSQMVPREPTEAYAFVQKYATFDGRGVKVAVLDTGVDPSAAGLSETSDGKPKVLEVVDASGDGDVALVKKCVANELKDASIENPTAFATILDVHGNDLFINKETFAMNPTNEWYVGEKDVSHFFPSSVVTQLSNNARARNSAFNRALVDSEKAHLEELEANVGAAEEVEDVKNQIVLLEKAEAQKKDSGLSVESAGFVCACVVFKDDAGVFRALIDKDGSGDLTSATQMASYSISRQYEAWSDEVPLTYCININMSDAFDEDNFRSLGQKVEAPETKVVETEQTKAEDSAEGEKPKNTPDQKKKKEGLSFNRIKLSIVVDIGSHATHVASILSGYHPEEPKLNGVAPGAQIVSLKIGDGRLDGMETSKSITRAVSYAVKSGCHLVNMSFGEAGRSCLSGSVLECIDEAVKKHGLIFVTSAGNSGPCLSTIGSPGNLGTGACVTVGAFLNSRMRTTQYQKIGELEKTDNPPNAMYDWSSRGPTYAGSTGVDICAPGGAIASVAAWSGRRKQQMNGTSMSSPNCCGCIALILSGLKQNNIPYSPSRVKRAICNTAKLISELDGTTKVPEEHLSQGSGLIQTQLAYELLEKEATGGEDLFYLNLPFRCTVQGLRTAPGGSTGQKSGIYLRNPLHTSSPSSHTVVIKPEWCFEESFSNNSSGYAHSFFQGKGKNFAGCERGGHVITRFPKALKNKLQVELRMESEAEWVKVPDQVLLHGNESFAAVVDPRRLSPGIHFTNINIFDSARDALLGEALPLIQVPVTVIIPHNLGKSIETTEVDFHAKQLSFSPGSIHRFFLAVPQGATWAELKITKDDEQEENSEEVEPSADIEGIDEEIGDDDAHKLMMANCFFLRNHGSYRADQTATYAWMTNQKNHEKAFTVNVEFPGVLEVCLCQSWRFRGKGNFDLDVRFQGLMCSKEEVSMSTGNLNNSISITNLIRDTRLSPKCSISSIDRELKPNGKPDFFDAWDSDWLPYEYQKEFQGMVESTSVTQSQSSADGSAAVSRVKSKRRLDKALLKGLYKTINRKTSKNQADEMEIPGIGEIRQKMHGMVISYDFEMQAAGKVAFGLPLVHDILYESPFSCLMVMVFSEFKQLQFFSDAFPTPHSLSKGKYVIRVCLCHRDLGFLKKFSSLSLKAAFDYTSTLILNHATDVVSMSAGLYGSSPMLPRNHNLSLYLKASGVRVPDWIQNGDVMKGRLTLTAQTNRKGGDVAFSYVHTESKKAKENPKEKKEVQFPAINAKIKELGKTLNEISSDAFNADVTSLLTKVAGLACEGTMKEVENIKARIAELQINRATLLDPELKSKATVELCEAVIMAHSEKQEKTPVEVAVLVQASVFKAIATLDASASAQQTAAKELVELKKLNAGAKKTLVDKYFALLASELAASKGFFGTALKELGLLLALSESELQKLGLIKKNLWKKQANWCKENAWLHLAKFSSNKSSMSYPLTYELF